MQRVRDAVMGNRTKIHARKKTALVFAFLLVPLADCAPDRSFHLMETSIADIHKAMQAGTLTCHNLVQQYLDRIHAYDQQGPAIKILLRSEEHTSELQSHLNL